LGEEGEGGAGGGGWGMGEQEAAVWVRLEGRREPGWRAVGGGVQDGEGKGGRAREVRGQFLIWRREGGRCSMSPRLLRLISESD
jgi:hypothetical protein